MNGSTTEIVLDSLYFTSKAKKCRWLAERTDQKTAAALNALADEFELRAIELDEAARRAVG